MPNRVLRDTTTSERVNQLSFQSEVLMYRLFMKADDFGSYYANARLIKSTLFPLKDNIRETDITRWLDELKQIGLILFYEVEGKNLLRVIGFNQRLRNMRNAFPHPENVDSLQVAATCSESQLETKRNETKQKQKTETEGNGAEAPTHTPDQKDLFKNFQVWLVKNAPRVNQMKDPLTIDEYLKLREKFNKETLCTLLLDMQNYKPLLTKSVSAYLTILKWNRREEPNFKKDSQNGSEGQKYAEEKARKILNS